MPPSPARPTTQPEVRPSVDQQDFDSLLVPRDADRAIAPLGLEVFLPGVARLEDMAVCVDCEHARLRGHGPAAG